MSGLVHIISTKNRCIITYISLLCSTVKHFCGGWLGWCPRVYPSLCVITSGIYTLPGLRGDNSTNMGVITSAVVIPQS